MLFFYHNIGLCQIRSQLRNFFEIFSQKNKGWLCGKSIDFLPGSCKDWNPFQMWGGLYGKRRSIRPPMADHSDIDIFQKQKIRNGTRHRTRLPTLAHLL